MFHMEMYVDRNCSVIAGLVECQSVFIVIRLVMKAIIIYLEPSVCQHHVGALYSLSHSALTTVLEGS